jgi:hypothetical protein
MASQQVSCTGLCNGLQWPIARVSAVACVTASFDRAKDCIPQGLKTVSLVARNAKAKVLAYLDASAPSKQQVQSAPLGTGFSALLRAAQDDASTLYASFRISRSCYETKTHPLAEEEFLGA